MAAEGWQEQERWFERGWSQISPSPGYEFETPRFSEASEAISKSSSEAQKFLCSDGWDEKEADFIEDSS